MSEERPFEVPEGPKGTNEEGRDEAALTGFSDETPMGVARGMKAVNEGGNQGWGLKRRWDDGDGGKKKRRFGLLYLKFLLTLRPQIVLSDNCFGSSARFK